MSKVYVVLCRENNWDEDQVTWVGGVFTRLADAEKNVAERVDVAEAHNKWSEGRQEIIDDAIEKLRLKNGMVPNNEAILEECNKALAKYPQAPPAEEAGVCEIVAVNTNVWIERDTGE